MFVPDEHYFGNILNVLDPNFHLNNDPNQVTFDVWSRAHLKIDNNDIVTDSYIHIKKITNTAIDELRNKKYFFIRKVDKDTEIDVPYLCA